MFIKNDQYLNQCLSETRLVKRKAFLKGEAGVYLSTLFRQLGLSLISIFIPVYFYKMTGSLQMPFLMYALVHLVIILTSPLAGWLTSLIGLDLTVALGNLIRVGFLWLLVLSQKTFAFIYPAMVLWGLSISVHWIAFHYTVIEAENEDDKFGKEASYIKIIYTFAKGIAPLIGGIIIVVWGFNLLYLISGVLITFASVPLFFDSIKKKNISFSMKKVFEDWIDKNNYPFWMGFWGAGVKDTILGIAWPLFVFLSLGKYQVLGLVQTATLIVSLLFLWRLGKWIDKKGIKILKIGVWINNFIWIIRAFLINPLAIFISNFIYGLGSLLIFTPFDACVYEKGKKRESLEFLVVREIMLHVGGLIGCAVVYLMLSLKLGWVWIFGLGIWGLMAVGRVSSIRN